LVGCARATNQTSKVENQIRKSLGLLILIAFRRGSFFDSECRGFHAQPAIGPSQKMK
jgi:hypothetical protein